MDHYSNCIRHPVFIFPSQVLSGLKSGVWYWNLRRSPCSGPAYLRAALFKRGHRDERGQSNRDIGKEVYTHLPLVSLIKCFPHSLTPLSNNMQCDRPVFSLTQTIPLRTGASDLSLIIRLINRPPPPPLIFFSTLSFSPTFTSCSSFIHSPPNTGMFFSGLSGCCKDVCIKV